MDVPDGGHLGQAVVGRDPWCGTWRCRHRVTNSAAKSEQLSAAFVGLEVKAASAHGKQI